MSHEEAKKAASLAALDFIAPGMKVGLGTGSTAKYFIEFLGKRCQTGLVIQAVATSKESERLAKQVKIPMLSLEGLTELDLVVDGADEIDPQKRLIKGAGGAFVREKIIAMMSKKMIVIADETKQVDRLGKARLPVEVIPFGSAATQNHLEQLGCKATLRTDAHGAPFVSDNHNWIFDLTLPPHLTHIEKLHLQMISIPGVVDTGFFFHPATQIVIGKADGTVVLQPKG